MQSAWRDFTIAVPGIDAPAFPVKEEIRHSREKKVCKVVLRSYTNNTYLGWSRYSNRETHSDKDRAGGLRPSYILVTPPGRSEGTQCS
jgi:hypothetical protein